MGGFEFWRRWLLCVCGAMVLFGVGLALFDTRIIVGPFQERFSESLWGQPTLPAEVLTYHRFVHGVVGATVAGWALTMAFVVQYPFRRREAWAWWALLAGPSLWFVMDVSASLYHGVWPNAVLNVVSYLPLLVPLLMTRREFGRGAVEGSGEVRGDPA